MNNVSLVGNIVRDLDLKYSASGVALLNLTIAVKRQFKDSKTGDYQTDFINCKAFNKTAEIIANNMKKGSKLGIVGSIQTGSYEKSDGSKVYTTDIIISSITFLDSKSSQSDQSDAPVVNKDPFEVNKDPFAVNGSDLPF